MIYYYVSPSNICVTYYVIRPQNQANSSYQKKAFLARIENWFDSFFPANEVDYDYTYQSLWPNLQFIRP